MKWVGKWIDTMLDLEGGQKDNAGVPLSHAQGFGLYPEDSKEPLKDSKLASGEISFIFFYKKGGTFRGPMSQRSPISQNIFPM